jgi:hypothetical protein
VVPQLLPPCMCHQVPFLMIIFAQRLAPDLVTCGLKCSCPHWSSLGAYSSWCTSMLLLQACNWRNPIGFWFMAPTIGGYGENTSLPSLLLIYSNYIPSTINEGSIHDDLWYTMFSLVFSCSHGRRHKTFRCWSCSCMVGCIRIPFTCLEAMLEIEPL